MAQKTVGYVELEWTCPRCGTRVPGTVRKCPSCGAPMEEATEFELPAKAELIEDEEQLAAAGKGPDVHCPYCGSRNPAGAETCGQCGASLKEAAARAQGRVLGAQPAEEAPDVACPFCGALNPADASDCGSCGGSLSAHPAAATGSEPAKPKEPGKARVGIVAGAIGVFICLIAVVIFSMMGRTEDTTARVQAVEWERSVPILELRPVDHQAWQDEIPSGAALGSCTDKHRRTENEPVPGATEVCGTPYTIDEGSGLGKVVQDCVYEVYEPWCSYTVSEWTVVDTVVAQGRDLNPQWPGLSLASGQREGAERSERYVVSFSANDNQDVYDYKVDTAEEFARFVPGSRWTLKVNSFGDVVSVMPVE